MTDSVKVCTWRHPIVALDLWWEVKSQNLRLDHNFANLCMIIGLICASASTLLVGPTPTSALRVMPPNLQMAMCSCIFGGLLIKLQGVAAHSRFWFPRWSLRRCYQLGYNGAPIAAGGLFVYGFYLIENSQYWTSALAAVLTPLLGLGVLGQGVVYWLEARRLERVERELIRIAKQVKGIG